MVKGSIFSVPIMRPHLSRTVLYVSILAVLLLALNAECEDSECEIAINVRRHTVYEAFLGQDLIINCTVVFCNDSPPAVSWYKVENNSSPIPVNVKSSRHIKTEWKKLRQLEGISQLIFNKILRSDSGLYRCRSGAAVSHSINVSINDSDEGFTTVVSENETSSTTLPPEVPEDIWMYVNLATGIVAFVIIVTVISVLSMQGCKGKSKKETETENQYVAIPMVEEQYPHVSLQSLPRGSPAPPPSRRSTPRKTPSSKPKELPRDDEDVYDKIKDSRERQMNVMEDEGSSVVYAALNHQLPPGAAAPRPRRQQEDFSEYAAIRVS